MFLNNKEVKKMKTKIINADEATRVVESLLNLKREKIITQKEVRVALNNIPIYSDIIKTA